MDIYVWSLYVFNYSPYLGNGNLEVWLNSSKLFVSNHSPYLGDGNWMWQLDVIDSCCVSNYSPCLGDGNAPLVSGANSCNVSNYLALHRFFEIERED